MPMSNAKGTPIMEREMAQNTAMKVMAVSWPRNHRCTVWYMASKHLPRPRPPPRGEERDEPVDPGRGPDDQVDRGDENDNRRARARSPRVSPTPAAVDTVLPVRTSRPTSERLSGFRPIWVPSPKKLWAWLARARASSRSVGKASANSRDCVSTAGTSARPEEPEQAHEHRDHRQDPPRPWPSPPLPDS